MESTIIAPSASIALFVKNILQFEGPDEKANTILPFFADGYPGLMYQQTAGGMMVNPYQKLMPELFLYGQTIQPIELVLKGSYRFVVFQLYPFVLSSFFNVRPQDLNDECYDLTQIPEAGKALLQLQTRNSLQGWTEIITSFLYNTFAAKKEGLDFSVREAIGLILDQKGQYSITELTRQLHTTERTLERKFIKEAGISPRQFSKIIRFQSSLEQLTTKDYTKLTDIVYNNGFADQSHFIKVFKAFTGKTPRRFR